MVQPLYRNEGFQNQDELLLEYLLNLEEQKSGRNAVLLKVSMLQMDKHRYEQLNSAVSVFSQLNKMRKGQLFILKNFDLFFVYKSVFQKDVETSIFKLRYMFSKDPFLSKNYKNSKQSFETFFDVENDFSRMLHLIRNPCSPKRNKQSEKIGIDLSTLKDNREQLCLMRPSDLNEIEKILENSDITNMIVSEPICSLIGNAVPQPLVDEYYFSMETIGETLIPGIDIEGSKWLCHHLKDILDRHMLINFAKKFNSNSPCYFCIDFSTSTFKSREFSQFNNRYLKNISGSIILKLQLTDVLSDINQFMLARDYARDQKYHICIDGFSQDIIPLVQWERLGVDFVKVMWIGQYNNYQFNKNIEMLVNLLGVSKVILSRCDDKDATSFGQNLGLKMFQGLYIQKLIADATNFNQHK